jgi:PKD repeat protein
LKLKHPIIFIVLLLGATTAAGQAGMWTWVHGDTVLNSSGNPGVMGIPDPLNKPPSMYEPVHWIDDQDNLWLYGGYNAGGELYQALWIYSPYTNTWTWMQGSIVPNQLPVYGIQGIPSPANTPGSRSCALSWIDQSGDFWLMGGYTISTLTRGDLWKLDKATFEWTWMNGDTSVGANGNLVLGVPTSTGHPQAVAETNCAWTDDQNQLWYYGGIKDYYATFFEQVIKYNILTNEWTLVRNAVSNSQPVYGTQGIPASTNTPGSRIAYAHWRDASGNFWLMNGSTRGLGSRDHNDVWQYNPVTNEWTWMAGSQVDDDPGSYNSFCDYSSANAPAARSEDKATYKDGQNRIWTFAGTTSQTNFNFNDLWIYNPDSLEYQWMHGTSLYDQPGVYGQLNVASPLNIPHSRDGAVLFGDSLCNIYMYGGISRHAFAFTYNDLWKFIPDSSCISCSPLAPSASFSAPGQVCPGTCVAFSNLSVNATSFTWTFAGAVPATSTDLNPSEICYNTPGSYDVTLIATGANGSDTLTITNYVTVYPYPPPQGIAQSGDTLFANTGAVTYQWYFNGSIVNGATDYFFVALQSGNYNVVCTDTNNCEVEAAIFDVVAEIFSQTSGEAGFVFPNPAGNFIAVASLPAATSISISIFNVIGENVAELSIPAGSTQEVNVHALAAGMYYIRIGQGEKNTWTRFIKQ